MAELWSVRSATATTNIAFSKLFRSVALHQDKSRDRLSDFRSALCRVCSRTLRKVWIPVTELYVSVETVVFDWSMLAVSSLSSDLTVSTGKSAMVSSDSRQVMVDRCSSGMWPGWWVDRLLKNRENTVWADWLVTGWSDVTVNSR